MQDENVAVFAFLITRWPDLQITDVSGDSVSLCLRGETDFPVFLCVPCGYLALLTPTSAETGSQT